MKRQSLRPDSCTATGYMLNLSYSAWHQEARIRGKCRGDKQAYCRTCGLCRWQEERESCRVFVPAPELDAFYAEEAKRDSIPSS